MFSINILFEILDLNVQVLTHEPFIGWSCNMSVHINFVENHPLTIINRNSNYLYLNKKNRCYKQLVRTDRGYRQGDYFRLIYVPSVYFLYYSLYKDFL
jgi:hypothetical protein